jgi:hypothetical protein
MILATYWLDIWAKPRLQLSALDEMAMALEVALLIGAGFLTFLATTRK